MEKTPRLLPKKPTTDSDVQTNTERPTKLALNEAQLAHFRKLRNIKDKGMRYYLHLVYLEKYKANNIVPKGLKITIEPFLGKNDKDLDKEWNDTTTDASLKLLDITIKKLKLSITDIDKTIKETLLDMEANIPEILKDAMIEKITTIVENKEHILRNQKNSKWARDNADTSTNTAVPSRTTSQRNVAPTFKRPGPYKRKYIPDQQYRPKQTPRYGHQSRSNLPSRYGQPPRQNQRPRYQKRERNDQASEISPLKTMLTTLLKKL